MISTTVRTMISLDKQRTLHIDLETYSSVDLAKSGLYKYVDSPDFEILLLAYAWDDDPVQVLDLTGGHPAELDSVIAAIENPDITKVAHNCAFERTCLRKYLGCSLFANEWQDTMILAAMNGLPQSLDAAGAALRLQDQKIKEGTSLISYFCKPCKPTISNGERTRNLPRHAPDKWERFKTYCARDVEVEREIFRRLSVVAAYVPDWERRVFELDSRINDRGVLVDLDFVESALAVDRAFNDKHFAEMQRLTGLDNPGSVAQLKQWLESVGVSCDSLNKQTVMDLIEQTTDPTIRRVLELRQQLGKTSIKKYETMQAAACRDGRVRGIMQYYGAGRTGRWAGRIVQPQNLPQNHLEQIDIVRGIVRDRDLETLETLYDNVPDTLSQLIRTALIAKPGHTFLVADYSAIEARVIAYLAGEQWRMDAFANGGDIYCSSASAMFHVPVEKHGINGHLRQKGKIAELACSYGGGVGALKAFGADKMGLTDDEMQSIVTQWRAASPSIPQFWQETEKAVKHALRTPGRAFTVQPCGVKYIRDRMALRCVLPSGRQLSYWAAHLDADGSIRFMGQNQTTRKWEQMETWGGKLVENIVQAFARDCLAVAMLRLDAAGFNIVFHVHDEVIVEAPEGSHWEDVADIMGQPIDWAPGLLLRGDGYETKFYRKD
nr:MAG TPA: DNA polymerase I [Caudoviricetes sp.]